MQSVVHDARGAGRTQCSDAHLSAAYSINVRLSSQFDRDGYVVLEDFLTPAETEALRAAGDSLARNVPQEERKSVFADQVRTLRAAGFAASKCDHH